MGDITVEKIYEDRSAYIVTRNGEVIGRVYGDEVATALRDRCPDAPEVGGGEPVRYTFRDKSGKLSGHFTTASRTYADMIAHTGEVEVVPLYAHPPEVGLPEGWVAVPVEPTQEMIEAADEADEEYTFRNFGAGVSLQQQSGYDHYVAMLSASPPCPGVVSLPEGWPWTGEGRRAIRQALRPASGRHTMLEAEAMQHLANWLESAGQKESGDE